MNGLMKPLAFACVLVAGVAVFAAFASATQDEKKAPPKAGAMPAMPAMPGIPDVTPTKEHQWLAQGAGTWKVKGRMWTGQGEPTASEGVSTTRMMTGGLWAIDDYAQNDGKFAGHGVLGYDPGKKKYVGIWVDTMSKQTRQVEGSVDATGKVFTASLTTAGPDGAPLVMTETFTTVDATHRHFELTMPMMGATMKIVELDYTKS